MRIKKNESVTLYDTCAYYYDDEREIYKELNDYTEAEMEDVDDNEIWEFISQQQNDDFNDLMDAIREKHKFNAPCVVTGILGKWTGRHSIVPKCFETLEDAILACIRGCDYYTITQKGYHLEVTASDHDGTSDFEIHLLNNKGYEAYERIEHYCGKADLNKACYHKAITEML